MAQFLRQPNCYFQLQPWVHKLSPRITCKRCGFCQRRTGTTQRIEVSNRSRQSLNGAQINPSMADVIRLSRPTALDSPIAYERRAQLPAHRLKRPLEQSPVHGCALDEALGSCTACK